MQEGTLAEKFAEGDMEYARENVGQARVFGEVPGSDVKRVYARVLERARVAQKQNVVMLPTGKRRDQRRARWGLRSTDQGKVTSSTRVCRGKVKVEVCSARKALVAVCLVCLAWDSLSGREGSERPRDDGGLIVKAHSRIRTSLG